MYKALTHFFELIKVSLGVRDALSAAPTAEEWKRIFFLARKQTLVGVCFTGVERLPAEQRPPKELVLQWFAMTQQIERRNLVMDQRTEQATQFFRSHGFKTAVLKGQGIAQLYPRPERRQSGDIDIWLDGGRERIYAFAREHDPNVELQGNNHHIHYHLFEDTEVEAHIFPSYFKNPFLNRHLHHFFTEYPPTDGEMYPSLAFNRVFILVHAYRHLLGEGVGLRQVMDYYYVLRQGFTSTERSETIKWLEKLSLTRFAKAITWVLKDVFGLTEEYWLVEPNEAEGQFLLAEICETGNMGHYDERDWGKRRTVLQRLTYNLRRDAHFVMHYPHEIMWQTPYNIWFRLWKSKQAE